LPNFDRHLIQRAPKAFVRYASEPNSREVRLDDGTSLETLAVPLVMESPTDEEETNTMKKALVLSAFLTALFPLPALAQSSTLVAFDGGIGVIPVSSAVGAGPTSTAVN
jgi:hypothetical protein